MNSLADEVRLFCSINRLRLNKDLGQHYLIDEPSLEAIVQEANISDEDHIVEIGPGIGVLTRELLKVAKKVTAIEIDERAITLLKKFIVTKQYSDRDAIHIVHDNALHVAMPKESYKIVANIPYHITSPLLRHVFLESEMTPTSLTLLIQKEVAEKICSSKDAGILTVLVHLFGTPHIVQHVAPKCFLPPPKVDSSVLHITCYEKPIADKHTIEQIFTLTKLAFSQKRKMLSNTIGTLPKGKELLQKSAIDTTRRPQTLSVEEWKVLAENFSSLH